MITLKQVSKIYRMGEEDIHALDKVNLTINKGEYVAIMGPSGSGKSTLANIVGGLESPTGGSIEVNGHDISKKKDKELSAYRNRTVGYVFQNFNLQPNLTALENVSLPLMFAGIRPNEREKAALAALKKVGLGERVNHKPGQLSGGQRQRVSIARALVVKPALLIADEPTGNLDSSRGKEIMELIGELNKNGLTVILITHDKAMTSGASRIISLKDGKLGK